MTLCKVIGQNILFIAYYAASIGYCLCTLYFCQNFAALLSVTLHLPFHICFVNLFSFVDRNKLYAAACLFVELFLAH